ncbi:MAG: hypothetical protein JO252_10025 [Planctomycetaceae bacterium]|nr:hypothetical protein [Planctomycetaceae bacterium]MBV8611127.1 hypothetical protein [Singulisphaera sp.]
MPFIIMQQVQPSFIMVMQQSQQAWIISVQALSPKQSYCYGISGGCLTAI